MMGGGAQRFFQLSISGYVRQNSMLGVADSKAVKHAVKADAEARQVRTHLNFA